ncbi:hypothetical protein HPB48_012068 [Haemaphysalis longicornis]|uniref:Uncharacterized protein n=1 Tax=Haemaphysalis longicornis TaxID=44386 RepID=A0A9J6GX69_HAELO|nr:hypothetical protein HPB48_012068 [Haemaphysalis longicornis]
MAAGTHTTERLPLRFTKPSNTSAVVGDSVIKYVLQHFCPSDLAAPAFISHGDALYEDVSAMLEYLPQGVEKLIMHVGTTDIARSGFSASLAALLRMLDRMHLMRPYVRGIFVSLTLQRGPNRRRRGSNHRFAWWFYQLCRQNDIV